MREIEVRLYHASEAAYVFTHTKREHATLPGAVDNALAALASGDAAHLVAQLAPQATLTSARGEDFAREAAKDFLAAIRGDGPFRAERHGSADDGRFTATELTFVRGGEERACVAIAHRGENGFVTSLRLIG